MIPPLTAAPPPSPPPQRESPRLAPSQRQGPTPGPMMQAAAEVPEKPRFYQLLHRVEEQGQRIDRSMAQVSQGRTFTPMELLALQNRVYSYSQNMEVISRLVDRTVSTIKTTLNTQV